MLALNTDTYGDGDPLLLIHGLFGSATNWRAIAKRLSADRQVIAVDLRNHGGSPHHDGMTYPDMAGDLEHLISSLDAPRVDILGHSMGGKAAMLLALEHPQIVARLIVADIAPVAYTHSHADLIAAMAAIDLSQLKSRSEADRTLSESIPDTPTRLFLLQNLVQEDGRYRWRLNLSALERHMADILSFPATPGMAFSGPTLFIRGGRSDYVQAQHDTAIRNLFPEARLETIADAGHWVHADQPDALITLVTRFLQ